MDRVLSVMSWFYGQAQDTRTLFDEMDNALYGDDGQYIQDTDDGDDMDEDEEQAPVGRQVIF